MVVIIYNIVWRWSRLFRIFIFHIAILIERLRDPFPSDVITNGLPGSYRIAERGNVQLRKPV